MTGMRLSLRKAAACGCIEWAGSGSFLVAMLTAIPVSHIIAIRGFLL